ncbi:MAG: DUF1553 domain-containing protein, partial [Planctomycetota bacterium]
MIDADSKLTSRHAELKSLKHDIRQALAADWLGALPSAEKLLARASEADSPSHLLHALKIVKQNEEQGKSVLSAWQSEFDRNSELGRKREEFGSNNVIASWTFDNEADLQTWYRHGVGLESQPSEAGDFAIRSEGNALQGIYPSGVYSHLLSSKLPARLTSQDIVLDEDLEIWVQAIGDSSAQSRYVVQDYPRNGTVYPVTSLKPIWKWHRYDLKYWRGDTIHLELTTGKDAPLLVKNKDRSWFGVRQVIVKRHGSMKPVDHPAYLDTVLVDKFQPENLDAVATCYLEAIESAIRAWEQGTATDAQAELLWQCVIENLLPNQLDQLSNAKSSVMAYRKIESEIPVPVRVPGLDETRGRTQELYLRGNHKTPGAKVPRRFLQAIDPTPYQTELSGRLELAEDLLRADNPLTKRVIVNRLWHHLFGAGLVRTPDNFGRLGAEPTHPKLLDYLALRFEEENWSLKKAIRFMVTSETWKQSSKPQPRSQEKDPQNLHLARANIRRLEAEAIRDALLSASGRLDQTQFGASVSAASNRRSVYVQVIRNSLVPLLRAFDFPEPFTTKGRRDVTNVPAQSLTLMNDPQVMEYARSMAQNAIAAQATTRDRVR